MNAKKLFYHEHSGVYWVEISDGKKEEILKMYPGHLHRIFLSEISQNPEGVIIYSPLLRNLESHLPIWAIPVEGNADYRVKSIDEELTNLAGLPDCQRKRRELQLDTIAEEFPELVDG